MLIFVPLKIVSNYLKKSPLQVLCLWRTCTVRMCMICEKMRYKMPCTQTWHRMTFWRWGYFGHFRTFSYNSMVGREISYI